ncbi:MAG: hypothetical protein KAG98_04410, partial [Lentisphaeria bacterium]|nr:hypothetical protein [Lentisphaeria bacterium]
MNKNRLRRAILISCIALFATQLTAEITYPGVKPTKAKLNKKTDTFTLGNNLITATWKISEKESLLTTLKNVKGKQNIKADMPLFAITLASGDVLNSSNMKLVSKKINKHASTAKIVALFENVKNGTKVKWFAELKDGSNYIRQGVVISPTSKDLLLKKVVLLDLPVSNSEKTGTVNGSPVVAQNFFFGFEHPMAGTNVKNGQLIADWVTPITVITGVGQKFYSVIGVYPNNQLRRAFQYYLERERARPYRPYLHYNSWFDLNISNGHNNQMTSKQAEDSITKIGEELVIKRNINMDGFVLDDGWDYHDTLEKWDKKNDVWGFNSGFPNGFTETKALAFDKYKAGIGVWLSPFGG